MELGSGTGLVGLVVGQVPDTKVWITDQASVGFFLLLNTLINVI